jgi:DDE superfamily endonuclease
MSHDHCRCAALMPYNYCCVAAVLVCKVHPSLIINMDQTGVRLVPSSRWTYEEKGSKSVAVTGAEDKRQITVCIASALDGSMPPLQLIFQGKTDRCLSPATPLSVSSLAHLTYTENHWSNQVTMQQYITEIIMPYANRCVKEHRLPADARIILLLDVWSVHRSEAFRKYIRTKHPRIHLVFVPANCTSKLQVADVALQRPFKHGVSSRFNQWAAEQVREQITSGKPIGLADSLKMSTIKPLALDWCVHSWADLKERKHLILEGWRRCCTDLFDTNDPIKRTEALAAVARHELDAAFVPNEDEQDAESDYQSESSDEEKDELDLKTQIVQGQRRSERIRAPVGRLSYSLDSSALMFSEDSSTDV